MERNLTEISEGKERAIKTIVEIFDNRTSFDSALNSFEKLGDWKWRFARACSLYQAAIRCRDCEHNVELKQDIEIVLLCSSIEAMSVVQSYIIFKNWLIHKKLQDLSMKKEGEIRKALNCAYQEYVDTEPDRAGASYNFRKFLTENYPQEFWESPIEIYNKQLKENRQATFEESINYIYAMFRSFFIHRGIGRATVLIPKGFENATCLGFDTLDLYRGKGYTIHSHSIVSWFENVVKESLWFYLNRKLMHA